MSRYFKLTSVVLLLFVAGILVTYQVAKVRFSTAPETPFENLSPKEMHAKIISQRDYAIRKAKDAGDYHCCIEPACTMCYMNANPWNNFTAGTCACDDLIARGEEPCPQCIEGLCESPSGDSFCEIDGLPHNM